MLAFVIISLYFIDDTLYEGLCCLEIPCTYLAFNKQLLSDWISNFLLSSRLRNCSCRHVGQGPKLNLLISFSG